MEYLTIEEVVARYRGKITRGTLANWRANRKGPKFLKLGGRVLYPLESLIVWEKESLRETT